jgi:hypothetical protein
MKTLMIIILLDVIINITGYSQLIFEGTFNDRFKTIQMDNGEQLVYIYNLDHTAWKKVRVPLPEEHLLDEIKSVTQTTFNKDTLVELVYSCVEYQRISSQENSDVKDLKIKFTLNIINKNGEMILKVPDSNDLEIVDKNGKRSLLIYKQMGKGLDNVEQILVYSLPEK